MQNRFEGCICCSSSSSAIQIFPHLLASKYSIPIQITSIQSKRSASCVIQTNALCDRAFEEDRNSIGILLGRHMFGSETKGRNEK